MKNKTLHLILAAHPQGLLEVLSLSRCFRDRYASFVHLPQHFLKLKKIWYLWIYLKFDIIINIYSQFTCLPVRYEHVEYNFYIYTINEVTMKIYFNLNGCTNLHSLFLKIKHIFNIQNFTSNQKNQPPTKEWLVYFQNS